MTGRSIPLAAGGMLSDTHLRILRVGCALDFQDAFVAWLPAANSMMLKLSQGLPAFGASSNEQALPARAGERNDFSKLAGELTRVQNLIAIGDAQTAIKATVGGQFTDDILPPSEEYLLGGTRFGRGFFAGEVSGDRALGASAGAGSSTPASKISTRSTPTAASTCSSTISSITAGLTTSCQETPIIPLIRLDSARAVT